MGEITPRTLSLLRWTRRPWVQMVLSAAFLLGLTLLVLGRVLFTSGDLVFSNESADLAKQFVHWRAFGFGELRAGRFPLWNPHIFAGTPFFGGFQSALLYPPNWLYLCLPLGLAINVGITLHVFLAGWFMQFWARWRGLHPLASVLAGVLFMFSGPYFLHIYAGHLSNLCTMVWGPLIFLAIDGWLERRTAGWLWLGAGAVAMQVLAGHPQYVFYTGIAAALYCFCHLAITPKRLEALLGFAEMVGGAVALSAVQLFEGFHAASQSVRNHGTSPEFAASFSLPPENFLTALIPGFFGDMNHFPYWGRFDLWEMSLFFGITGVVLAVCGLIYGEKKKRRFCGTLAAMLLLLALGGNTPLFHLLYSGAPGFGSFRGWSKFVYPAALFTVMLAAIGLDSILRYQHQPKRWMAFIIFAGSLTLGIAAWWLAGSRSTGKHFLGNWIRTMSATGEVYQPQNLLGSAGFSSQAASFSAQQMLLASGILAILGLLFLFAGRYQKISVVFFLVATGEMVVFATSTLITFRLPEAQDPPPDLPPGNYRILDQESPNLGMSTGTCDLWGYDPGVLRRYAEWMATVQGLDPDDATESVHFWNYPCSFAALLRCRYVFPPTGPSGDYEAADVKMGAPSSRLRLVSEMRVIPDRDDLLETLQSPDFDLQHCILFQNAPSPVPVPSDDTGSVRLIEETTDTLTIEADVPRAAILLVTDTYCTGWQARSLLPTSASVQAHYDVVPADYFLRAVPLQAGHHRLLLEYRPTAFVVGKWVSLTALGVYLVAGGWLLVSRHKPQLKAAS